MIAREVLTCHVDRLSSALKAQDTIKLEPSNPRWPTIEMYSPDLVHPYSFRAADSVSRECSSMQELLKSTSGANTTEMHASIDQRKSLGGRIWGGAAIVAGLGALAGIVHGFAVENILEVVGSVVLGFTIASMCEHKAEEHTSRLQHGQEQAHEQLRAWEQAIASGKPCEPIFEMDSTGNGTWDAWAYQDALPIVAQAAPRYRAQSVRDMVAGLKASSAIQELPDALVMGATRIRKRS